jgi:uncharacterized membrane-anchored protein
MSYRLALAGLYVLLVVTATSAIVCRLNPAIISAVAVPFVTLATATIARRRRKSDGDCGSSGDEDGSG